MPATSEARIRANQMNAQRSTGPKTPEGKEASRGNALKHGMAAATLIPEREAEEVERRYLAFCAELNPTGEVGAALVRQAAMLSTRSERCFEHENAMLNERVRQAEADFVPPEGVDEATAARLRAQAGKRALFDPSKEATLARRYEAEARRGFLRSLKELRVVERESSRARAGEIVEELASFRAGPLDAARLQEAFADRTPTPPTPARQPASPAEFEALHARADLPFAVGRRR